MARKKPGKKGNDPATPAGPAGPQGGTEPAEPTDPQAGHDPTESTDPQAEHDPSRFENSLGDFYARVTVPHELLNPKKRHCCGLPKGDDERGPYIIELNVQHAGSLPGAANAFEALYRRVIPGVPADAAGPAPRRYAGPVRISKSYYRCRLSVKEWSKLLAEDAGSEPNQRCIYKLWPDFPIKAQIDRSITTVKADAAHRAFDAGGEGVVWAVIDSGIDATHPHFGAEGDPGHLLTNSEVNDLHRDFAYVVVEEDGESVELEPLKSPDTNPGITPEARKALLDEHRKMALRDDLGHGTHVAGIIAGAVPPGVTPCVMEREYKPGADGGPPSQGYKTRDVAPRNEPGGDTPRCRLAGVAPRCKLVSLRVLNTADKGLVSSVISALEYVRESLNDNPKMMRVHGVNLSVGYDFDAEMFACGQSPLCVEVDRLVQSGVVVVTAAGNTGYGTIAAQVGGAKVGLSNTINDPGNAALAITVGSTHRDSPHTYGVSFFSSKGPTGDGRLKPDLVAPGERITSCAAGKKLATALAGLDPGQRPAAPAAGSPPTPSYIDDSGTSMAAPHVSGAVAAFLSIRREFIGKPQEVKRIFLESATPLGRERYFEGHGLVDLMRAIQSV